MIFSGKMTILFGFMRNFLNKKCTKTVPKSEILAKKMANYIGLIWPNLAPKTNFLGQNDYFILLNYFLGLLLVQFYKICWSRFFAMSQKLRFWPKWPFFLRLGQIWAKWECFSKKGLCYLFILIISQLHA